MLVPAVSVTDVDDDIKVLSLGTNHQAYSQTRAGVRVYIRCEIAHRGQKTDIRNTRVRDGVKI